MDLALNNLQRLICHKPKQTNKLTKKLHRVIWYQAFLSKYNWFWNGVIWLADWAVIVTTILDQSWNMDVSTNTHTHTDTYTHTHTHTHIYIYIYIYVVHSISFQSFFFFVLAFIIVVDSWKFTMLLLYILWDDWPILWFHLQMTSYSRN